MRQPKPPMTRRMLAAINAFHAPAFGKEAPEIPAARAKPVQHEHREQVAIMHWWRMQHTVYGIPLIALLSVPNAGMGRNAIQGARLKAEGVRAGVSDLFLAVPRHGKAGAWIEVKAIGGRESDVQAEFQTEMRRLGYRAVTVYGADECIRFLKDYLGEPHGK